MLANISGRVKVGEFEGFGGLFGNDLGPTGAFPEKPAQFTVTANTTRTGGRFWGNLELWSILSAVGLPSSRFHIHHNVIEAIENLPGATLGADFAFEGLFVNGLDDGHAHDNHYFGKGRFAINIGQDGLPGEETGWLINDNLFDFEGTAHIHLAANANQNTVIGAPGSTTTVKNEGDNNLINVVLVP